MPELVLGTGTAETHRCIDALHPFAQGAIKAALSIAPILSRHDDRSTGPARWNDIEFSNFKLGNMTVDAFDFLESVALRFYMEHTVLIGAAVAHGGAAGAYDLPEAGRDFWFTGSGCGMGYANRGLGHVGEALHNAARGLVEGALVADPVPPTPTHIEALAPSDTLQVVIDTSVAPSRLSAAERATLDRLARRVLVPPLSYVACAFGAPVGREDDNLTGLRAVVVPVTLDSGGYDAGGAYWGSGETLWRARAIETAREAFTRAATYRRACEAFSDMFAGIQIEGADL